MSAGGYGVTTWTLPVRGTAALRWCAEHDLVRVHFGSEDLEDSDDLETFRTTAAELGIELAGFAVRELERLGLGDLDAARLAVDAAVDVIDALGTTFLYLPSFNASEIRSAEDLARTAHLLEHALERTEARDALVATENTLDASEVRTLFELVDHRRLCLLFDTQNPALAGMSPPVLVAEVIDMLGPYVHVKDGRLREGDAVVGAGDADVEATLDVLRIAGYEGSFVLEGSYSSRDADGVRADVDALRSFTLA
jgi:sugar phosphate isomerase/epimerase